MKPDVRLEAAAVATVAAANVAVIRLGPVAAIPAGLGAAGALVAMARRAGATWAEMGLDPDRLPAGVRWGAAAALPIAAGAAVAATWPATRGWVTERRAVTVRFRTFLAHVLLRVPLATAATEEVIFRAALPAILRRAGRREPEVAAAALFGLWHVLPTLQELRSHREAVPRRVRAAAVAAATVTTFVGAFAFSWLRDRSGHLAAPMLAHAAANEAALLGGRATRRFG